MLSSRNNSGINLGVTALYSTARRTVLVSSGQRSVTFDIQANAAYDTQGSLLGVWAVVRNGMVFLPVDWLCGYFDAIDYTVSRTRHGMLVRITSGDVIVTDPAEFIDMADSRLAENLRQYQDSVAPSAAPATSAPTAAQTAPPSAQPSAQAVQTSQSPEPSAEPSEEPEEGAEVYLALRWGGQGTQAVQLLEDRGLRALILMTPEELRTQDDVVRRLVGAGHGIGLVLTGADGEECLEQAAEGRRLLAAAARCGTVVVSAAALDQAGRDALRQEGYALWSAAVRGGDYASGEGLVRALNTRRANYVELACDGTAFLRAALNAMENAGCQIGQPTAPML